MTQDNQSIALSKIIDKFNLETLCLPDLPENIQVTCARVNRPGLQMVGFYDHYEKERMQIIGIVEHLYLEQLSKDGELMGYYHDGFWQCMDMKKDWETLEKLWESGEAPWKNWED